jgi:hypothetical protein
LKTKVFDPDHVKPCLVDLFVTQREFRRLRARLLALEPGFAGGGMIVVVGDRFGGYHAGDGRQEQSGKNGGLVSHTRSDLATDPPSRTNSATGEAAKRSGSGEHSSRLV